MLRPNGTYLDVHAYMNVRQTDIKPAANTIAKHIRITKKQVIFGLGDFKEIWHHKGAHI